MLSSHRYSRYKDHGRLNSSIRWKENNNVKRVDSVKVGMLSNLCKIVFYFALLASVCCFTSRHCWHVDSIYALGTQSRECHVNEPSSGLLLAPFEPLLFDFASPLMLALSELIIRVHCTSESSNEKFIRIHFNYRERHVHSQLVCWFVFHLANQFYLSLSRARTAYSRRNQTAAAQMSLLFALAIVLKRSV